MKCSKCGFVSYPGLDHCRKCGHKFVTTEQMGTPAPFPSGSSGSTATQHAPDEPSAVPAVKPALPEPEPSATNAPEPILRNDDIVAEAATLQPTAGRAQPWQEELSGRVESFRRRRARLQGSDSNDSLDLDFEATPKSEEPVLVEVPEVEPDSAGNGLDLELENAPHPERPIGTLDAVSLEELQSNLESIGSAGATTEEVPLQKAAGRGPVEILVGPRESPGPLRAEEKAVREAHLAPIGRRFLAGLADGLILLLGAGIFALIFWRAGGHFSPNLVNYTVAGFISVFFIAVYFGLFIAVTATTPGLLWMALEVRNLEGADPTPGESSWRAFGYLVSMSALMLGFIWAVLDGEGLTWHDRISGTFITFASPDAGPQAPKTKGLLGLG